MSRDTGVLVYGYHCICTYPDDAPEPEGTVLFGQPPKVGDVFPLPSSRFTEEWEVTEVDHDDMKVWAKYVKKASRTYEVPPAQFTFGADHDPEWLPDWATGRTDRYCVGAQLCTRDGRRMGNAVIAAEHTDSRSPWEVVTDAGTTMRLNDAELAEAFWPPEWVMNVSTSPGVVARAAKEAGDE